VIADTIVFAHGVLRPLRDDDARDIARACTDEQIARWTQIPQPYTLAHAEQFIADRAGEDHVWAIDVRGLAGVIGLRNTRRAMPGPVTEVGYWVAPWARRRGVATGALIAVREAAEAAGFQRIGWAALSGNDASVRVAQRAGFVVEGNLRQGLIQRGRLVDAVVGGWTARVDLPELVAGTWQLQPVDPEQVGAALRPAAGNALGVWAVRAAVGGQTHGYVLLARSPRGVHVVGVQAHDSAVAAATRYARDAGWEPTDLPPPHWW
jgi:RimJ/RimL family protein N-acetyltransferase